jgi:tetratricopeptide (TPR) repeat protein
MKRTPYFLLLAGVSAGLLVILNWNLRPQANERGALAHAQTLVALGEGKPAQLIEASRIASQFIARDPFQVHALFVQAWAQQRLGQREESMASYEAMLAQIHDIGRFANYNVAILYEIQGDSEQAVKHFLASASLDPKLDFSWVRAINVLQRLNRIDEAKSTVLSGLKANPSSKDLLQLARDLGVSPPTQ